MDDVERALMYAELNATLVERTLAAEVRRLRGHEEAALAQLAHASDTIARLEKRVRDLEAENAQLGETVRLASRVVRCWEDDETIDAAFDELRANVNGET